MILKINKNSIVVLDLDDTLYKEIDFLRSAFWELAKFVNEKNTQLIFDQMFETFQTKGDVFSKLIEAKNLDVSKTFLIEKYRNHIPNINLSLGVEEFLIKIKRNNILLGIITDGRSRTQRNKIKSLKITSYFDEIIISEEFGSEKPSKRNYIYFEEKYKDLKKYYIGDNFEKDFLIPNKLKWTTIGILDNGENIHPQNLTLHKDYLPQNVVVSFAELNVENEK